MGPQVITEALSEMPIASTPSLCNEDNDGSAKGDHLWQRWAFEASPLPISLLTQPQRDIILSVLLPGCALQRLSPALPVGKPGAGAGLRVAGVGEMHFAASMKPTTEQNDLLSCGCLPTCSM